MGLPACHVTGVPGLSRNEQLKALGNGVVPQQAYSALTMMAPTWVCDSCLRSVTRDEIGDMCDGEHVLCRRCIAESREAIA